MISRAEKVKIMQWSCAYLLASSKFCRVYGFTDLAFLSLLVRLIGLLSPGDLSYLLVNDRVRKTFYAQRK